MNIIRIALIIFAALNALMAVFLMAFGNFADGAEWWERLILTVLHPVGAVALILLVALPRPSGRVIALLSTLLALNIAADAFIAATIAAGITKGDFILPLLLAVFPTIGLPYAIYLARRS